MSYSLSFDASCKLGAADAKGYLNHFARDVNEKNGIFHNHENPNIDKTRTHLNKTYVMNEKGKLVRCDKLEQIMDAWEKRLDTVTGRVQKNSIVARPLLLQLDPQWYKDNPDKANRPNEMNDMLKWVRQEFGRENVVSVTIHSDETNDHMSVLFTPVTNDGRLSQKDFFKNPTELRGMHDRFRAHMTGLGYDINPERQPAKKRLNESEFRTFKAQEDAIADREKAVLLREQQQDESEIKFKHRLKSIESQNEANEKRDRELVERELEAALKSQNIAKYEDILTASALNLLRGDEKCRNVYDFVEQNGILKIKPDMLQKALYESTFRINTGQRKYKGGDNVFIKNVVESREKQRIVTQKEDDGPEL